MSRGHHRALAAIAGLGISLSTGVATAQAPAPALTVDRPCYTADEAILVSGTGFTPNGQVAMSIDYRGAHGGNSGTRATPLTADAAGAISDRVRTPEPASAEDLREKAVITATDQARSTATPPDPNASATATFKISIFDVFVPPWDARKVDPRKRVTVHAYGWEPFRHLWAFYVLRGRVVRRVRLGTLRGACGNLTVHMREFPFRPVRPGSYAVYFEPTRSHNPRASTPYRHVRVTRARAVP